MILRLLHIHSGNLFGGIEVVLQELAATRHLEPALEHEFALSFEGDVERALGGLGATVHRLGAVRLRNPWSVARARRTLETLLAREPFDACICHSPWTLVVFGPGVRAQSRPLFLWAHGAVSARQWLDRWAAHTRPDLVICNSRFTEQSVRGLFPGVRSEVVYAPLRPRSAPADRTAEARRTVRLAWRTPEEAVVIAQAGRMEPLKGQMQLLEALAVLRDDPRWICWQVGGPQRHEEVRYFNRLTSRAGQLGIAGRVAFLGAQRDVPALLGAADVYCQPNLGPEAFGVAFIEALDAGLPVVTMDMGGPSEIMDPSCGILVPPGDVAALAAALERVIDDEALRARLGAAGPARARALTDPARQLRRLADIVGRTPTP